MNTIDSYIYLKKKESFQLVVICTHQMFLMSKFIRCASSFLFDVASSFWTTFSLMMVHHQLWPQLALSLKGSIQCGMAMTCMG